MGLLVSTIAKVAVLLVTLAPSGKFAMSSTSKANIDSWRASEPIVQRPFNQRSAVSLKSEVIRVKRQLRRFWRPDGEVQAVMFKPWTRLTSQSKTKTSRSPFAGFVLS
jgi:hypothetical protein